MDGNLLGEVSEEKNLGVISDKELKFHSNTALVVNKISISHCFANLSSATYTNSYTALLFPRS